MDTKRICTVCGKPLVPGAPEGLCPECLLKAGLGTGVDIGADTGKAPRFVPPKIEELAAKFPQLEILEFIGQGGMGAVYKARQKQLDRIVALKILPPQAAAGPGFAERFTREARALARLNHPHIVTLYEFGQADGLFYFLMEFVDGINLRLLLAASRMAPREALAIVPQICEALQFAHDTGIVHRDIKPENILLDKKGQVKIADFGVAKLVTQGMDETASEKTLSSGDLTEAGSSLGTPQYMAPEQIKNSAEVDHRADIYSLGVVFYQMLTGELPSGKIEPPSRKVVIDVRLDEVVLRALEKKPELRFQQASDVKTIVETIATTPQPSPSQATPPGWKHYKDNQWHFELDLPAGWNPFPPVHSNSPYEIIRFMSHENGKHMLILFRRPHNPGQSLKEHAGTVQQHLAKSGFGNFVSVEATVGSKPAQILDFDRPMDDGTWSCRYYIFAEGALGYTVGFATTDKAALFETFERMVKSFQFQPSAWPERLEHARGPSYFAPKTKTAAADEPPPGFEKTDLSQPPYFTSRIVSNGPDLGKERLKSVIWGFALAALCVFTGANVSPAAYGWAIATWGVVLFLVSAFLVLHLQLRFVFKPGSDGMSFNAIDSPKKTAAASMVTAINGIGTACAGIWCAFHSRPQLSTPWFVIIVLACLGAIVYCLRCLLKWSNLIAAGAGDASFPVDPSQTTGQQSRRTKWVHRIVGGLLAALIIIFCLHTFVTRPSRGTATRMPANVEFHWRVFEADAGLVDQLIPAGQRRNGVQADVISTYPQGVPITSTTSIGNFSVTTHGGETDSQMAEVSLGVLDALLQSIASKPGMLADQTRVVSSDWWHPGLTDTWGYTRNDVNGFSGNGSGLAYWGVQQTNGVLKVRIDCLASHGLAKSIVSIAHLNSRLLFEGPLPPKTNAIIFLVPFIRQDGSAHYLVVAFDFNGNSGREARPVSAAPFIAHFPKGSVELAAVGSHPATNRFCWLPNGAPSLKPFPTGFSQMDNWVFQTGMRKLAFHILIEGPDGLSLPDCQVDKESGVRFGGSEWDDAGNSDTYFAVALVCPADATTANISLGLAYGPWETALTLPHDANTFNNSAQEDDWRASYNAVTGSRGDVAVSCIYPARTNCVTRMVYVNENGQVIPIPEDPSHASIDPQTGATLMVSSKEFAQIKEFQVQRRKYQWVEFDNVSLRPGYQTDVRIKDLGVSSPSVQNALTAGQTNVQRNAEELSFGPTFERVINDLDVTSNSFLNLATGEFVAPPSEISKVFAGKNWPAQYEDEPQAQAWIRENHVDIAYDNQPGSLPGLILFDGFSTAQFSASGEPEDGSADWNLTPGQLSTIVNDVKAHVGKTIVLPQPHDRSMSAAKSDLPKSFLFQTRDGSAGVLQIVEYIGSPDKPGAVKVRYRLVNRVAESMEQNTNAAAQNFSSAQGTMTLPSGPTVTSIPIPLPAPSVGADYTVAAGNNEPLIHPQPFKNTNAPSMNNAATFGPVMERTIYDYKSGRDWLLDLETGETFSLPPGMDWDRNASAVWEWAHLHGVHVMGHFSDSQHWHTGDPVPVIQTLNHGYGPPVASQRAIYGFEMKAAIVQLANLAFETITPLEISNTLQEQVSPPGRDYNAGPWLLQFAGMAWHSNVWSGTDDYLYAFQTDDGRSGVLQITGFSDNPRGVKIRYKLVPNNSDSQAKRQRFEPVPGMADKTSWGVVNHSEFNPDGWAVLANMTLGGVARITPGMVNGKIEAPAAQSRANDVCRIRLVDGDDDKVTLEVDDLKWNKMITVILNRDQWADLTVNGINYKIGYCSVWVAPDKPDTSPFANITVTHSEKNPDLGISGSSQSTNGTMEPADLREAKAHLAELHSYEGTNNPEFLGTLARVNELERLTKEEPNDPPDLREVKANLAELRTSYGELNPKFQEALARIQELERLTKDEPNDSPDLREAKAHLAEMRVDYGENNPALQQQLQRIKQLEQFSESNATQVGGTNIVIPNTHPANP